jgi:MFS family permease
VHGVAQRARFADVLAVSEARSLWLAQVLSVAGDQLARVALTVLVFQRTYSALLTAVTYALTFLPWVAGGLLLSGLADRHRRREVMVACDLVRAALVTVMALPGMPLGAMAGLLFAVTLLDSPFKSARAALFADILSGDLYVLGTALTQITLQVGIVCGFALGGVVVAFLGVRTALLADVATFVISALLIGLAVRYRPPARPAVHRSSEAAEMVAGIRLVFTDRRLRTLMFLGWLVTFYVVPQGLAVPYAAHFRGLPTAVAAGLVFAAGPLGTAIGATAFGRLVSPPRRLRWMGPLAVSACAMLMLCALRPGLVLSLVIFAVSGGCAAYQIAANAAFVTTVPHDRRSQTFGLANGGMQVTQGVWFVLAGAIAAARAPATVIAVSGAIGAVLAIGLSVSWRRQQALTRQQAAVQGAPRS